jgi:hypothetical protein
MNASTQEEEDPKGGSIETSREGSSRPQEIAAPIAAKRGKVEDDGGKRDIQAAPRGLAGHPCFTIQGDYQFRGWDPGGLLTKA